MSKNGFYNVNSYYGVEKLLEVWGTEKRGDGWGWVYMMMFEDHFLSRRIEFLLLCSYFF